MKRYAALALTASLMPLSVSAFSQSVPALANFQGRLAKPDGTPVVDGTYNLQFSVYNASTGGTLAWQKSSTGVAVKNGVFTTKLDFSSGYQNSVTQALLFGGSAVYLEISINGAAPLAPRQQLLAVPYAFTANTALSVPDGSITSAKIASGVIPTALPPSGAAGGDLAGTYPNPQIAPGVVGANELALSAASLPRVSNNLMHIYTSGGFTGIGVGTSFINTQYPFVIRGNSFQNVLRFHNSSDLARWHLALTADGISNALNFVESGVSEGRLYLQPGGNVGVGTIDPATRLDVNGTGRFSGNVQIVGNLAVTGIVTKLAGSFKIDHPLDPANKTLSHSFVESPDMMNIYNGNIVTDANGRATVALPKWFSALNKDYRYGLTVIGEFAQAIIEKEIANNRFVIRTSKPRMKVSWQVTGIRNDAYAKAHRIPTEENKTKETRGAYLFPDGFAPAKVGQR